MEVVYCLVLLLSFTGLDAGKSCDRHVTYQVHQLYQACPANGNIVVNGSGSQEGSDELKDIRTKLQELNGMADKIKLLSARLDQQEAKLAMVKQDTADKTCAVCDSTNVTRPDGTLPADCTEVFALGGRADGVYVIKPRDAPRPFRVLCELTLDGGWTVIMRRFNGSVDFYRKWKEYKDGFGSLDGEHWLGNDNIHWLTSQKNYRLRVDFTYWSDQLSYYAEYRRFSVADESAKYKLSIADYRGNSGFQGLLQVNGFSFTTWDADNDIYRQNCAQVYKGAFWYDACHHHAVPTALYQSDCTKGDCMCWGIQKAINHIIMKVRA